MVWVCAWAVAFGCTTAMDPAAQTCEALYREGRWKEALSRCRAEYAITGDADRGTWAARAAYYRGDYAETERIARTLIPGPREAHAYAVRGWAALRTDYAQAVLFLERALALHIASGAIADQAIDAQQLSGAYFYLGMYALARDVLEAARAAARRVGDRRTGWGVELAMIDVLRATGKMIEAQGLAWSVVAKAVSRSEEGLARFKLATLMFLGGDLALARDQFEHVLASGLSEHGTEREFVGASHLNIALIDALRGEPLVALGRVEQHAARFGRDMTFFRARGLVFAALGRHDRAIEDLRMAEELGANGEWSWTVPYQIAVSSVRLGDRAGAVAAALRAVERVEALADGAGTYAAAVFANHRRPYLLLVDLYAAEGRWRDALDVVARMDRRAMLHAPGALTPVALIGDPIARPAPPRAPLGETGAIAAAWRGRTLAILVPGDERAWRLVLRDGEVTGDDLGSTADLAEQAVQLAEVPEDPAAARALGGALLAGLPPGRVDVLAIGVLGRAPLGTLRVGDRLALEEHQLVRVPGVLPRPRSASPVELEDRAVVMGEPLHPLPASAAEAAAIAASTGGALYLHAHATRAALATAAGAELLHVSAGTERVDDEPMIALADGPLRVTDVHELAPAPRLVVLAICGAAAGHDDTGRGSLAHAFLEAGAESVVATRTSVDDADAARLVHAFYDAGGARDPAAALAAAQRELEGVLEPQTWAAFEVIAARPRVP